MRRRTEWRIFWRTVVGRAYPRVIGLQREKSWMLFEVLLPLLQVAAYVYIYRAIQAPPEFTGFVVLGGAMTAYWMNILWSMASQLYWEKETGNLELYIIAPTSRMAILLGMAAGGIASTTIRALGVLTVGVLIFRVPMEVTSVPALVGVFLLTLVALYGMGMLMASLFLLWGRQAWHLANLLQEPVFLLSGFYFPVRALGFLVALGASIVPITLGLDAMRQLLYPQMMEGFRFLPVGAELGALAVLGIAFLFFAHRALRFFENLARREGRLTLRGQ
ncbi:MAG: ABC transporter permease [Candidatus Acetothermia bacterium]|jgi:ABC-2 type transport system permease protein|nr:ABC transporter permease [Candidatus Acetothermia bacterium]